MKGNVIKYVLLTLGAIVAGTAIMSVMSIINPQGSQIKIQPTVVPEMPVDKEEEEEKEGGFELMNKRSLAQMREACYYNLDEKIEEIESIFEESRGRRWENFAQVEGDRLGISSNEYLLEQFNRTTKELIALMPMGSLPTTSEDAKKFRDLLGKLKDLREALVSRPTGKRNVPATSFLMAIQDCQLKAINHNNVQNAIRYELINEEW